MAKYKLVANTCWANTKQEEDLDFFTDEDFKDYEDGKLSTGTMDDLQMQAQQMQGFEWGIEVVEEDED